MRVLQDYPTVIEELELVEESDQVTHFLSLDDAVDGENTLSIELLAIGHAIIKRFDLLKFFFLDIFKFDSDYLQNEERYQILRKGMLK